MMQTSQHVPTQQPSSINLGASSMIMPTGSSPNKVRTPDAPLRRTMNNNEEQQMSGGGSSSSSRGCGGQRVSSHSNSANQAIEKGKYREALDCYQKALKDYLDGSPGLVELVNAAATCFNLGALSKKLQDFKQAGEYFCQAENLYRTCSVKVKQLPNNNSKDDREHKQQSSAASKGCNSDVCLPQLIVETLQARAHLHYKYQKWLDDAIDCHELVVEVLEEDENSNQSGDNNPVTYSKIHFTILDDDSRWELLVSSLQSLGKFYVERGDLEDGLMAYQETLRVLIKQQESGKLTKQRQDEISQIVRALTEIYVKSKPVETEVPQLQEMAFREEEMENWERALSHWERILFLQSQNFGEDSVEVASTLSQIARVMILEGNYEGGLDLYHAAIAKYVTTQTPISKDIIANAADAYCRIGQQSEAISWMNDLLSQTITAEESATIHFELGKLYLLNGELAQASDALCHSAEICETNDEHVFKLLQKVEFLQQRTDVKATNNGVLTAIIEDDECSATVGDDSIQDEKKVDDTPAMNNNVVDRTLPALLPSLVETDEEENEEGSEPSIQDPEVPLDESPDSPRHVADETIGDSCCDDDPACSDPSSPLIIPAPADPSGCLDLDGLPPDNDVAKVLPDDDEYDDIGSSRNISSPFQGDDDDGLRELVLHTSSTFDETPFDEEDTPEEQARVVTPGGASSTPGGALSTISSLSPLHEHNDHAAKQHHENTSKATDATEQSLESSPGRSPSQDEVTAFENAKNEDHDAPEMPALATSDDDVGSDREQRPDVNDEGDDSWHRSEVNNDEDGSSHRPQNSGDDDHQSQPKISKHVELPPLDHVDDAPNHPVEIERQSPIAEIGDITAQKTEETPEDQSQPVLSIVPTSSSSPAVSETSRTGLLKLEEKPAVQSKLRLPSLPASSPKNSKTRDRREYSEINQASRAQSRRRFVQALSSPFRRSKTKKPSNEHRSVNEDTTVKQTPAPPAAQKPTTSARDKPEIHEQRIVSDRDRRFQDRHVPISFISLRNRGCDDDDDQSQVSQITFKIEDQAPKRSQHDSQWWWGVTAEGLEGWFPTSYVNQAVEAAEGFLSARSIHERVKSRPLDFDSDDESEAGEDEVSSPLDKSSEENKGSLPKPSIVDEIQGRKTSTSSSGQRPSFSESVGAVAASQSEGSKPQSLNMQIQEKLEMIDRAQTEKDTNGINLGTALFELAVLYSKQGDAARGIENAERALKIQKSANNLTDACKTLHFMADIQSRLKQYQAALSCYSETQRMQETVFGYFHEETANTLNRIGNVLARKGEFDLAMENHKEALRILKECFGEEIKNPLVSQTLIQIGAVYYKERNSLATIQSKVDGYSTFIEGGMLEVIGRAHEERGSYKMAIAFFEEKLQFLNNKTYSNDLEQVAETLNSLGMLSCRAGMYLEAIDYYDRALAIQMELGCDDIQLSMARVLAGSVQYALGHFKKAMKLFEDAITTLRQEIGSEQETIAATLFHMGVVRVALYDYDGAMTDLKEAYTMQSKLLGNDHPATLRTRREMANLYAVYLTEVNSAFTEYQSIIATQIRIHGKRHPNVAETMHYFGCAYAKTGDYASALKSLEDCYNMRLEFLGSDHPLQGTTLHEIAKIQLKRGRIKKALYICESALSIRIDSLGEHHIDVATTMSTKASCLVARGSFVEANQIFTESLKIAEAAVGSSHPSVAVIHSQIGIMHLRKCHFEEASEEIRKALEIYRKSNLDEDHPGIKEALQDLERVERAEMLCV